MMDDTVQWPNVLTQPAGSLQILRYYQELNVSPAVPFA